MSVAPTVPVPPVIAISTLVLLSFVARLPNSSMISTSTAGRIAAPTLAPDGCATNTKPVGGPGSDVADIVASTIPKPRTVASNV